MITPGEKIFSLFSSAGILPDRDNLKDLWSEFYCYLFLALLFNEDSDPKSQNTSGDLVEPGFFLPAHTYHSEIGRTISKGLFERFYSLVNNVNISDKERDVLRALNKVFQPRNFAGYRLSGRDILAVAELRGLDGAYVTMADYVSVMVGQDDFYHSGSVPRLKISLFGNIYLDKGELYTLVPPELIYGQMNQTGDIVTGLWALLSSMTQSLSVHDYPGDKLVEVVTNLVFMSQPNNHEFVPLPRYASSVFLQKLLGLESFNPVYISALFYKQFLYGSVETSAVSRSKLLWLIMRSLSDAVGDDRADYLFSPHSSYGRISVGSVQSASRSLPKASVSLHMAVEALDSDPDLDEPDVNTDVSTEETDPVLSPEDTGDLENSMDLVSFNKAGEGVNEDLYRSAVVALNDRIQSDPTFPVTPEVKQALNQWVNGWIYRAAISATKDQIATLKLAQYLKTVSHIPTK